MYTGRQPESPPFLACLVCNVIRCSFSTCFWLNKSRLRADEALMFPIHGPIRGPIRGGCVAMGHGLSHGYNICPGEHDTEY